MSGNDFVRGLSMADFTEAMAAASRLAGVVGTVEAAPLEGGSSEVEKV